MEVVDEAESIFDFYGCVSIFYYLLPDSLFLAKKCEEAQAEEEYNIK